MLCAVGVFVAGEAAGLDESCRVFIREAAPHVV